jgi:hypothetical protein
MNNNKPLWQTMHDSYDLEGTAEDSYAAMIRSVAKRIEKKRSDLLESGHEMSVEEVIRWLGYEAERAENGE